MLVHRNDLSVEIRFGNVANPIRRINDVEIDRDDDGTRRVDAGAIGGGAATAALTAAVGRAVFLNVLVDLLNFDVVGVARLALSAGVEEVFMGFKNGAVGGDDSAVTSDS
ncbi:MAG TPA: hypothetical protein VGB76_20700 [Pyrinomonadaceae bacterium]